MEYLVSLLIAGLLPALILIIYIYIKDRNKPEPLGWLFLAFCFGIVSMFLSLVFSSPFNEEYDLQSIGGAMQDAFLTAAIPEELAKFIMLFILLKMNKHFDEHFDGIVYSVCIGMGFAAPENLLYLLDCEDTSELILIAGLRAVLTVPAHYMYAVFMGYFYSLYHFRIKRNVYTLVMILAAPILAHGIFDALVFLISSGSDLALLYLLVFIVFFVIICVKSIKCIKTLKKI